MACLCFFCSFFWPKTLSIGSHGAGVLGGGSEFWKEPKRLTWFFPTNDILVINLRIYLYYDGISGMIYLIYIMHIVNWLIMMIYMIQACFISSNPTTKTRKIQYIFRNLLGWMDTHLESSQVDSIHPKKTPFEK